MERLLFNSSVIALPSKITNDAVTIPVDVMVTYATKYGLFIPTTGSGYQFLRWLNKGCPELDFDNVVTIVSDLIHITNDGEVYLVEVDSYKNSIRLLPYTTDKVTYLSLSREHNEAYSYLFSKRKLNMVQAIELVATGSKSGFYNPIIITVEDWVKHAKENNLTELFFRTRLSSIRKT